MGKVFSSLWFRKGTICFVHIREMKCITMSSQHPWACCKLLGPKEMPSRASEPLEKAGCCAFWEEQLRQEVKGPHWPKHDNTDTFNQPEAVRFSHLRCINPLFLTVFELLSSSTDGESDFFFLSLRGSLPRWTTSNTNHSFKNTVLY